MASACHGRTMSCASPTAASISPIRGYAFRSSNASSTRRRSTGSHPTAATSTSPISNTRTGSLSRPMSACVANTRHAAYIHRIELDSAGNMVRRSIFADMSSDEKIGVPDGMKVDVQGNVYCTGPGGTWVYAADGTHIGTIKTPEVPANLAFGGPDMKTLFFTAHTSVYSMRVKVAGLPGHPFKKG